MGYLERIAISPRIDFYLPPPSWGEIIPANWPNNEHSIIEKNYVLPTYTEPW